MVHAFVVAIIETTTHKSDNVKVKSVIKRVLFIYYFYSENMFIHIYNKIKQYLHTFRLRGNKTDYGREWNGETDFASTISRGLMGNICTDLTPKNGVKFIRSAH